MLEKVMSDKEVEALRENRPPEASAPPEAGPGKKRKDSAPLGGARCVACLCVSALFLGGSWHLRKAPQAPLLKLWQSEA